MGQIERKFTWFSRDFTVSGPEGQPLFNIHGPFFRAWTFEITALDGCVLFFSACCCVLFLRRSMPLDGRVLFFPAVCFMGVPIPMHKRRWCVSVGRCADVRMPRPHPPFLSLSLALSLSLSLSLTHTHTFSLSLTRSLARARSLSDNDAPPRRPTPESGTKVGIITKEFSGMMQEWFTDADNFGVQFYDNTRYGAVPSYQKVRHLLCTLCILCILRCWFRHV
jgi:hypothetical protein